MTDQLATPVRLVLVPDAWGPRVKLPVYEPLRMPVADPALPEAPNFIEVTVNLDQQVRHRGMMWWTISREGWAQLREWELPMLYTAPRKTARS